MDDDLTDIIGRLADLADRLCDLDDMDNMGEVEEIIVNLEDFGKEK